MGIFGLPGLRTMRNSVYRHYFRAQNLSVSDYVFIVSAHKTDEAYIKMGQNIELGRGAYIDYSGGVEIGNNVAISEAARIYTHNHNVKEGFSNWHLNGISLNKLVIDDDAWIGAGAIILPSVSNIGKGAVIGAGSVVTKNVESYTIVAGNPARFIGKRTITENI